MILLRGPLPWRPCPKRALEASPAQGIDGLRLTTHLPTRIDLTSWPLSPQLKSEAWWAGTIFSKHLELWLCQIQALIPALALTSSVTLGKVLFEYHSPHLCEKAMAPNSSTLAWKIPWMEVPGGLQSMGLQRVGHDSVTSLSLFTFMYWRRKWKPTPVFLPGESQGRGSLVGCHLWGRTESDTTEAT